MRAALAPLSLLTLLTGLLAGCEEPAPLECQAYIGCFYGDEPSPYEGHPDYARLVERRAEVLAAYGDGGECWRNGRGDLLAERCREGCLSVIDASCRSFREGGDEGFCVLEEGGEQIFQGGEASISCAEAASELAKFPQTADAPGGQ